MPDSTPREPPKGYLVPLAEYAIEIDQDLIYTFQLSDEDAAAIEGETPVLAPTLDLLAPATAVAGAGEVHVSINGNDFAEYSRIVFDGRTVNTVFVSDTQLRFNFVPGDEAATLPVTVRNSGQVSNSLDFTVTAVQE